MPPPLVGKKHERPVGAGLSLDKFAGLGVSKFDKRRKLERIKKEKIIKHSKYSKLKKKLEAQGLLARVQVKDSVAELEALDAGGPGKDADPTNGNPARVGSHSHAGPADSAHHRGPAGGPAAPQPPTAPQGGPVAPDGLDRHLGQGDEGLHHGPGQKRPHEGTSEAGPSGQPGRGKRPRDEAGNRGGRSEGSGGKGDGQLAGGSNQGEGGQDARRGGGKGFRRGDRDGDGRKLSQLQRLAEQVAQEKAEKLRAKEAAMKERQERMKRVAAVEKTRKEQKHIHFKRTAKGQPVMRYRMEKLLSQLEDTK